MAINRLDNMKVNEGVTNLLKLFEKRKGHTKTLITSPEPIYLQIDFVKIPRMKKSIARIPLHNSLLTDTSDVCLIVADVIRGRNVNHNITISHYTRLLKKRGVMDVQKLTILPSRQIRVEYAPYEARRKLCNMYDIFLIDNKISSFLYPKLGKEFFRTRKWPIPIRMKRKNLKDEILSKLKKTSLALDGAGTSKAVQIGHLAMTSEEITENIISAGFYIMKYFPGGWNNIRSLHIKGPRTAAVPIYMSLVSPNEVPVPKIKGRRKKSILAIDELSTAGRKVTVYRSGAVKVHDFSDDDSEDVYETDEDEASDETKIMENETQSIDSNSKKRRRVEQEIDTEKRAEDKETSEEDDEEDDAETNYLIRIQKEGEEENKQKAENQKNFKQSDSSLEHASSNGSKKKKLKISQPIENTVTASKKRRPKLSQGNL